MEEKTQIENPPAFPFEYTGSDGFGDPARRTEPGMTLRDYFAAKNCAAMVSTILDEEDYRRLKILATEKDCFTVSAWIAKEAYKQADAMLKARMKPIE